MFLAIETLFNSKVVFGVFYAKIRVFMVTILVLSINLSLSCIMCFLTSELQIIVMQPTRYNERSIGFSPWKKKTSRKKPPIKNVTYS